MRGLAKGETTASSSRKLPGIQIKGPEKKLPLHATNRENCGNKFWGFIPFWTLLCLENTNIKWACVGCAEPGPCSSGLFQVTLPGKCHPQPWPVSCTWYRGCHSSAAFVLPHKVFHKTFIHQGFFWCLSMTWVTSHLPIKYSDLEYEHLNHLYKTMEKIKL